MLRLDSGVGSKGAAGIDIQWQVKMQRVSGRNDKSKTKERQGNIRLTSNKPKSSSLHVQQLADLNKG